MGLFNMGLTTRDSFSYLLLVEEGLFFCRLLYHQKMYSKFDGGIGLIELPFTALICHDALPFINRTLGAGLREDYHEVARIRHRMKSFDPKFFNFEDYSRDVNSILANLNHQMKDHSGFLAPLANFLQPDIGLFYYQAVPVSATYTVTYYVAPNGKSLSPENVMTTGYETGQAAAFLYSLAEQYYKPQNFFVPPFQVQANDINMSALIRKYRQHWKVVDKALFFLLTERMMQLSSVDALRTGGFLNDALWCKFATVSLFHTFKSISSFETFVYSGRSSQHYSSELLKAISSLFTREEKKILKKISPLRNAMVHYDFSEKLLPIVNDDALPYDVLAIAVKNALDMSLADYYVFLTETRRRLIDELKALTSFPDYSKLRDPDL